MEFFNPDGSGGMMCGNGGRCIVAFAADLGVVSGKFPIEFEAPDGHHTAILLPSDSAGCAQGEAKNLPPPSATPAPSSTPSSAWPTCTGTTSPEASASGR